MTRDGDEVSQIDVANAGPPSIDPPRPGVRVPAAGAIWEAMERGEVVAIDDVRDEDDAWARRYRRAADNANDDPRFAAFRGWLAVPLETSDRVGGMLTVSSTEPAYFTPQRQALVRGIANQAAVAIENARLFEQAENRTRELSALLELSRAIASTLDLRSLVNVILIQFKQVLDYNGAALLVRNGDTLAVLDGRSITGESAAGLEFALGALPLIWSAIGAGEPVLIGDVLGETVLGAEYRALLGDALDTPLFRSIRSWMAVPLVVKDRVIGMMTVSRVETDYFHAEHARLARAIADHIAVAVENARLFEQAEDRTRNLAAMLDLSHAVASTLDLPSLVNVIFDQFKQLLDYDGASLAVRSGDVLTIPEGRSVSGESEAGLAFSMGAINRTWELLNAGEAVIIADVRSDEPLAVEYRTVIGDQLETGPFRSVRSWMAVPLIAKGRVMGMMSVSRVEIGCFTAEHARLARAVADQAAVALENAGLYTETERRARATEALFRADEELFRSRGRRRRCTASLRSRSTTP